MAGDKYLYNNSGVVTEKASIQSSAGAGDAGKIPALDSAGRLDSSMMPTGMGAETFILVAFENLAAGDFVNIFDDSGTIKVRKADASGGVAKKADGYVLAAATTGNNATIYYGNLNNQKSGLTGGATYYLSGSTPGGVTTTAPSTAAYIVQKLGKAKSATELLTEIEDPIVLA
jgi:hypothetical protein